VIGPLVTPIVLPSSSTNGTVCAVVSGVVLPDLILQVVPA
jgi:hypothetical protein